MRALALVLCLAAPAAAAQSPCIDGAVADDGLVFACSGVDLLSRVTAQDLNGGSSETCHGCLLDVWGWTDDATGREYALVGTSSRGVVFVDVTDPTSPRSLGYMPGSGRDVKVSGHHAYAGEHNSRGLLVFDLHRLRGLTPSPNRQLPADAETAPVSSHNVVAVEGAPFVASVGGGSCSDLAFYDVSEPEAPVEVGCYDAPVHDAQCLVYDGPDADWTGRTVCFGFNASRVGIVDVTDPGDIVSISEAFYPAPGYTHQGWLTEDRRYLLVGDEGDEDISQGPTRTIVLDVSDLDAPEFVGAYLNPSTTSTDHNQYPHRGYLYQATYTTGFRVLDLAGIATADLDEVAFFDTYPVDDGGNYNGAWSVYPFFESGTVIVSDQSHGLFVLRVDPARLVASGGAPLSPAGLGLVAETPARGDATVRLTVPAGERVRLAVYDLLGRELAVVYDGVGTGAEQAFAVGAGLPAGVVLVRAETAGGVATRRVTLVR